ncbi:MAG: BLUF domain-containing protein [Pelagimonas sp.]|jgi:hypothetical protein|nr:BLUF domain-containing protein [Pelagimonas sp.]
MIYAARAKPVDHSILEHGLEAAKSLHEQRYITGMLLMNERYALQLIEGERAAVTQRFLEVSQEGYHADFEILACGAEDTRFFDDWTVRYLGSQGRSARILKRIQAGPEFNPYKFTASNVESLCLNMSKDSAENAHKN